MVRSIRKAIGRSSGAPLDAIDQVLEMARMDAARRRRQAEPERRDELLELDHAHRIGRLVHAVERRHALAFEVRRHRLVGQQHELLDEAVRHVPLGGDDRGNGAVGIDHDLAPRAGRSQSSRAGGGGR